MTGATWTGQKHAGYRSPACQSHRYCRREETCRARERDEGSAHTRERQSERRKRLNLEGDDDPDGKKTSGARQRRPGERQVPFTDAQVERGRGRRKRSRQRKIVTHQRVRKMLCFSKLFTVFL